MKLFLDTNVLIDFLMERHPFYDAAASLVSYAAENQLEICTSALSIVNANFICVERSKMPVRIFRMKMDFLRYFLIVTPVNSFVLDNAYNVAWNDFEDCVQYYSALCEKPEYIVTRNVHDFEASAIPVLSHDEACGLLG